MSAEQPQYVHDRLRLCAFREETYHGDEFILLTTAEQYVRLIALVVIKAPNKYMEWSPWIIPVNKQHYKELRVDRDERYHYYLRGSATFLRHDTQTDAWEKGSLKLDALPIL